MIQFTNFTGNELYGRICRATASGAYAAYLRGKRCKNDRDCLRELSAAFQFPDYFGENWNAADECLADLEWLNVKAILVVVQDWDQMGELGQVLARQLERMDEYWTGEGVPIEILLNGG